MMKLASYFLEHNGSENNEINIGIAIRISDWRICNIDA